MSGTIPLGLPPLQVWPVIHVADQYRRALVQHNVNAAQATKCSGVMLIHMHGDNQATLEEAQWVRATYPQLQVGVNLLGMAPDQALLQSLRAGLHATWSDAPGVSSQGAGPEGLRVAALLRASREHTFFGSVAFKYQPYESDPPTAAVLAAQLGMLPTTSGRATGEPPCPQKLAEMRRALGALPLAVASGISPENLQELGPSLTHVLVATGVSRSFHELDVLRLGALVTQAGALSS